MNIKKIHAAFVVSMWDAVCTASRIGNKGLLDQAVAKLVALVPNFENVLLSLEKLYGAGERMVKAMRVHILRTV